VESYRATGRGPLPGAVSSGTTLAGVDAVWLGVGAAWRYSEGARQSGALRSSAVPSA